MLVILSAVSLTPSIAALAPPPCLIATIGVSLKFGVLGESSSRKNRAPSFKGHFDLRNIYSGSFAVREVEEATWRDIFSVPWHALAYLRYSLLICIIYPRHHPFRLALRTTVARDMEVSRSVHNHVPGFIIATLWSCLEAASLLLLVAIVNKI